MTTMTRIAHMRAIADDRRPTRLALDGVLARTSLSRLVRQAIGDAFDDAGLISGSKLHAAGALGTHGRYALRAVDGALAQFPPLARMEVKKAMVHVDFLAR
jgi:hypothetical protein